MRHIGYLLFLGAFALARPVLQAGPVSLTVYAGSRSSSRNFGDSNGGFAVVRQSIPLDLAKGDNDIIAPTVSPFLDPASVILRDPSGKSEFHILLQKFRPNALSQESMLARFEGQTIPFRINGKEVPGKIIRAGYWNRTVNSVEQTSAPIIEIEGRYEFDLPGTPVFTKLPEGELLKPELRWKISAVKPAKLDAELVYLTDGLSWRADYNAIVADNGTISQFNGWITLENDTGLRFEDSSLKLIAGNITRTRNELSRSASAGAVIVTGSNIPTAEESGPAIQHRNFDEYHEYSLPMPITLFDREVTQVELVRATNVNTTRSFIYDGSNIKVDNYGLDYAQLDSGFGTESSSKVAITSEFRNDAANHLGSPLPEGLVHFYRTDNEGRLQFSGDSSIGNTPQDEIVRATTGFAFDIVGERVQTNYHINDDDRTAEESYEIKIRNHRKEAAQVRVWEHPCRWRQWDISAQSQPFTKVNQQTFEFVVSVAPNEEKKVNYTIRYSKLPPRR